jgi:DNA-directed RNA polymerase subunit RPC12/RpoP
MYISYFKCKECGHGNDIEKPTHDKNLKCKKCGEAK